MGNSLKWIFSINGVSFLVPGTELQCKRGGVTWAPAGGSRERDEPRGRSEEGPGARGPAPAARGWAADIVLCPCITRSKGCCRTLFPRWPLDGSVLGPGLEQCSWHGISLSVSDEGQVIGPQGERLPNARTDLPILNPGPWRALECSLSKVPGPPPAVALALHPAFLHPAPHSTGPCPPETVRSGPTHTSSSGCPFRGAAPVSLTLSCLHSVKRTWPGPG